MVLDDSNTLSSGHHADTMSSYDTSPVKEVFHESWNSDGPSAMKTGATATSFPNGTSTNAVPHSVTNIGLVFVWVLFFYFSSVTANIMNKQLIDEFNVSPTMLTFWHIFFALIVDAIVVRNSMPAPEMRAITSQSSFLLSTLRVYAPVSFFIVLGKFATYLSYEYVSMSLTHTAKASEPIFNVVLSALFFGEVRPLSVNMSLIPIASGVAIASVSEMSYNHVGFIAATTSAMAKVLQNIYTKRVMDSRQYTFFEVHLWCAVASIIIMIPLLLYHILLKPSSMFSLSSFFPILVCSVVQYTSSLSSYMLLSLVQHLSFTIINTMKRLVIISSGMLYFNNWDLQSFTGVLVAVSGVYCYNRSKTKKTVASPMEVEETKYLLPVKPDIDDIPQSTFCDPEISSPIEQGQHLSMRHHTQP